MVLKKNRSMKPSETKNKEKMDYPVITENFLGYLHAMSTDYSLNEKP